jgi:hypothetical protein
VNCETEIIREEIIKCIASTLQIIKISLYTVVYVKLNLFFLLIKKIENYLGLAMRSRSCKNRMASFGSCCSGLGFAREQSIMANEIKTRSIAAIESRSVDECILYDVGGYL